jgi:hypothetical protein
MNEGKNKKIIQIQRTSLYLILNYSINFKSTWGFHLQIIFYFYYSFLILL